jgi:dGTPase
MLMAFWDDSPAAGRPFSAKTKEVFAAVTDPNEQISYLRAMLINKLVGECVGVFTDNCRDIMSGRYTRSLADSLAGPSAAAMKHCSALSFERIYNHPSVIEVELAGYRILGALLDDFIDAVLNPESHYAKKLLALLPEQFRAHAGAAAYAKIQSVLDFVSGMTDLYALELYRNIHGMQVSYQ